MSAAVKPEVDSLMGSTTSNLFSVVPNARAYIEIDEPLYFTGIFEVALGFGSSKSEIGDEEFKANFTSWSVSLSPGLTYFLSDQIALDLRVGTIGYFSGSSSVSLGAGAGATGDTDGFLFAIDMSTVSLGLVAFLNN